MTYNRAYMVPNPVTPNQAVFINPELCTGCGTCMNVCRMDVLLPGPGKGKPPIVMYPDECWFCGDCVAHCPVPGSDQNGAPLEPEDRLEAQGDR